MKLNVFAPSKMIIMNRAIHPNFCLDVDDINLGVNFINDYQNSQLAVRVTTSLNKIIMTDSSRQAKVERKRAAS